MTNPSATTSSASQPCTATPKRRQRGSSHTSLAAHGEPMVWLTGGALALALVMIVGLLSHILWSGFQTFWPGSVTQFTLVDGTRLLGEVTRSDRFRPTDAAVAEFAQQYPAAAKVAKDELAAQNGYAQRQQVRIGNFELTGEHFAWVTNFLVQPNGQTEPEWAVLMERLAWGRFYGFPERFQITTSLAQPISDFQAFSSGEPQLIEAVLASGDVKPVADLTADQQAEVQAVRQIWNTPETAWQQFQKHHPVVRERWHQQHGLQKQAIGHLNRQRNQARLALIEVQMQHGEDSPEFAKAQVVHDAVVQATVAEGEEIEAEVVSLGAENARYEIQMRTASDELQTIALADVVRAFPANQLTTGEKWNVYFSRWAEFLLDDPREANSEGGVFPAIWGTVAMTLLMSILVVPFGVIAALYLKEYAQAGLVISAVRIAINNLAGVPSIVFGVFGLGFFCYHVGNFIDTGPQTVWTPPAWWSTAAILLVVIVGATTLATLNSLSISGSKTRRKLLSITMGLLWVVAAILFALLVIHTPYFSGFFRAKYLIDNQATYGTGGLLWASLTLALLTLPVVIVATEEALAAVPGSMRQGSYACGASQWQTICRIVLPRALPGIMTGMILAMARGAGEVAPLMLVGVLKLAPELPVDAVFPFVHPERSFMHLGFHIYDIGFQSQNSEAAKPMVYTTTLLLVGIIVLLNVSAIGLRGRLRRRFEVSQF